METFAPILTASPIARAARLTICAIAGLLKYEPFSPGPWIWRAGLGVERAVGESMSVFVEATIANIFPVSPDWFAVIMGGVNWHLGR